MNYNEIKEILRENGLHCLKSNNIIRIYFEIKYDEVVTILENSGVLKYITIINNKKTESNAYIECVLNIDLYKSICEYNDLEKDLSKVDSKRTQYIIEREMKKLKTFIDICNIGDFDLQDIKRKIQEYNKYQHDLSIMNLKDKITKMQQQLNDLISVKEDGEDNENY